MRATPTPAQRHSLATLGYVAPLLRLMRCEVMRVVWTVSESGGRETSSFLLGPGAPPHGLRHLLAHATLDLTAHWLRDPDDEVAVNYDSFTGMVDVHRHGGHGYPNATSTFWIADIALLEPPAFAQPLGPLFVGTLEAGGAAVLADWFEEQPADWSLLAATLRTWSAFSPPRYSRVRDFRFTHTSPDAACWLFRAREDRDAFEEYEVWVLGLGVFGPDGLERAWHFTAPKSDDPVFADQFWSLFPAPPRRGE